MEYQKCPVCEGCGLVGGGFFGSPGYIDEYGNRSWASDHASETCKVCGGNGVIVKPENQENLISQKED